MFTLTIKTDNAAFDGDLKTEELARILRVVADKLEGEARTAGRCMDINGNGVGSFELDDDN